MTDTITMLCRRETAVQALRPRPPFNARPVCAAGRESRSAEGPFATHYTATASWLYINRISGSDRFGKVPDGYVERGDPLAAGRCHPLKIPPQLRSGDALWREADAAASLEGPRGIAATHIVADLPPVDDPARWAWLVETFAFRHLVDKGMIVDWAVHARRDAEGGWIGTPHVHLLATARFWRPGGRHGARHWQWFANAGQTRAVEDAWLQFVGARATAG